MRPLTTFLDSFKLPSVAAARGATAQRSESPTAIATSFDFRDTISAKMTYRERLEWRDAAHGEYTVSILGNAV